MLLRSLSGLLASCVIAFSGAAPAPALAQPPAAGAHDETVSPASLDTGFIILVRDATGKASDSSPIYLAGSINNWNAKDERFKLTAQSDMRWRLTLTPAMLKATPDGFEFKFTRGSWENEELKADYTVPGNKLVPRIKKSDVKAGEPPVLEYTVAAWGDTSPNANAPWLSEEYKPLAATGTLRRLQVRGGVGTAAGKARELLVWLPPGYDDAASATVTYPVLYLHDGQNLFQKHSGIPAEWGADETATALIQQKAIRPLIIVGVPHSGMTRIAEYSPPGAGPAAKALGEQHVAWLMSEVMPRVERAFRVKTGAANTAIGGSSMGGLISLYAAGSHPEVFGLVLAESPSLTFGDGSWWRTGLLKYPAAGKTYLGVGGQEGRTPEALVGAVKEYEAGLKAKGSANTKLVIQPEAQHTETAWASRLPEALRYLFPPE